MLDKDTLPSVNETAAPNPPPARVSLTPFCGDLRSKKYFMFDGIPTKEDDYMDPSGHCWCYHTQMPVGPDGRHVGPDRCGPERNCYRSGLSDPA